MEDTGSSITLDIAGNAIVADVVSLEYAESIDALDLVRAEIEPAWGASDDGWGIDVKSFKPGEAYTLKLWKDGAAVHTATGFLVEVSWRVAVGGRRRVTLVGLDSLAKLRPGAPAAKLWEAKHSDIVSQIANKNGLTPDVEGVQTTAGFELQANVSDALFIHRLCRLYNYYARVEDKKLKFARKQGTGSAVKIGWAAGLLSIDLSASIDGLVTKVTVHGNDYLQDAVFVGTSTAADLAKISGSSTTGVGLAKKAYGELELVQNHTGLATSTAVTELAKAELNARAEKFVRGTALVIGHPGVLSGKLVEFTDVPWPLAGKFLVRQTRHTLEPRIGYRTWIDFTSDSLPDAA